MIVYLESFLRLGKTLDEVTESRICYISKEISSLPNTENRTLMDDNRLGGDDSVLASGEGRINF